MHNHLRDIVKVLKTDETLLRLLYYPPEDLAKNVPDPLDVRLKNILEMDIVYQVKIRNEHIYLSPKADDLDTKHLCRIYAYAGRRRPNSNYLTADQEIIVDILCHFDYENGDLRSMRIADRINELICLERVTGMGRVDYVGGGQINCPKNYTGYQHIFKTVGFKK